MDFATCLFAAEISYDFFGRGKVAFPVFHDLQKNVELKNIFSHTLKKTLSPAADVPSDLANTSRSSF